MKDLKFKIRNRMATQKQVKDLQIIVERLLTLIEKQEDELHRLSRENNERKNDISALRFALEERTKELGYKEHIPKKRWWKR